MISDEEFGNLVNEIESLRDIFMEEITKLRNELEHLKEDLQDLKKELNNSGGINIKKRLG